MTHVLIFGTIDDVTGVIFMKNIQCILSIVDRIIIKSYFIKILMLERHDRFPLSIVNIFPNCIELHPLGGTK